MSNLGSIPLPQLQSAPRQAPEPEIEQQRSADGLQLACRVWKGKVGAPVILYLHGIEGHGQWFENTASVLNSKGMTVYAPDRRGSGLNARDRGHVSSYKMLIGDVNATLRRICQAHMGHPIIIWGNCWGAKLAAIISQDIDDKQAAKGSDEIGTLEQFPIAAIVLSSPAIFTKLDYDFKTKIEIATNHLMGGRRAMRKWSLPITPSMFTDNPAYLEYIEKDPLRLTEVTSTFLVESHKLSGLASKAAPRISKPIMILQPSNDQIVDIPKMEKWYAKIKSAEKSMRLFPDAGHSLDFDATWFKEYSHLVSEWLLARNPAVQ